MHSGTYATLLKMCTTIRGCIQLSITDLRFSSKWSCLKYHCLTICPVSGVQSRGRLSAQPQVNILINPQWIELRTMIIKALEPYPELRRLWSVLSHDLKAALKPSLWAADALGFKADPWQAEDTRLSLRLENGSRVVSLPGSEATIRGFSSV